MPGQMPAQLVPGPTLMAKINADDVSDMDGQAVVMENYPQKKKSNGSSSDD